jgi:hypothetical protein
MSEAGIKALDSDLISHRERRWNSNLKQVITEMKIADACCTQSALDPNPEIPSLGPCIHPH